MAAIAESLAGQRDKLKSKIKIESKPEAASVICIEFVNQYVKMVSEFLFRF